MLSVLREVFSHLLPPPYVCCCWVVAAFWHLEVQSCPTPSSFAALSLWPPQPRRRWLVSGRRTPNPAVLCPLTSPFTSKASCGSTNVGLGAAHPHFPRQDADSPPSIGAFSADALPSSVPFAIPRLPLHIPHSLPFLSARIPGITECRTPTRGCRAVQEHRAVPRPTAPCPPRAPILLTDCFLCRWSLPMAMSITHRGTGVALSLGVCTSGCCGLQSCGCWRSFISPCLSSCNSAFSRGFCSLLPPHSPPPHPQCCSSSGKRRCAVFKPSKPS